MTSTSHSLPVRGLASLAVIGLVVAACGSAATPTPPPAATQSPTQGPAASQPAATEAAGGAVVVASASTASGTVLVGPTGMTLYTKSGDTATSSTCSGGCLAAWPALTVPSGGTASAGTGVTGAIATFTRADDGTTQVTYNGKPLYYWASDTKPGDVTGDGIGGFSVAKP